MKMANARQRQETEEKKERKRETIKRREEEATAGMHPTFDLFKWADRLSHEGAICFFLESFSYNPQPDFVAKTISLSSIATYLSNGFYSAIVNIERMILNKFD